MPLVEDNKKIVEQNRARINYTRWFTIRFDTLKTQNKVADLESLKNSELQLID
jgi:hypothetical protein